MIYEFPTIRTIDDVLPIIEGREEFSVTEKTYGKVINYHINYEDTFPPITDEASKILRECRGMIFNHEGVLIRRPLEKFFNVGEKEFTKIENIDWEQPHTIYEKLDGSMIVPFLLDGHVRFGTKAGITDVSMQAEVFVAKNPQYLMLSEILLKEGFNPIFEWCSRQQRIVIDYPEDMLILLAIRHIESGEYAPIEFLHQLQLSWLMTGKGLIKVVDTYEGTAENMEALIAETRGAKDIEGYVVRFYNEGRGTAVKVKADEYVQMHRCLDAIRFEKNIIQLIVNDQIDDLLPTMAEDKRKVVMEYQKELLQGIRGMAEAICIEMVQQYERCNNEKKMFAISHSANYNPIVRSIMFANWQSGNDLYGNVYSSIIKTIKQNCGSQTGIDKIRILLGVGTRKWTGI